MKLLVASEFGVDAPGGGPAVVRQMLRGFPGEICWWSVKGRSHGELVHEGVRVARAVAFPAGKFIPARKATHLKAWCMEHVWSPLASRHLAAWVSSCQPDCLWVIPHDWSILPLHRVLVSSRERFGLQIRYHVTIQDYPDAHFHGRDWGWERAERMARMQEEIYRHATSCDATSYPMLADLEQRTGRRGQQMLHQGLEAEDIQFLENRSGEERRSGSGVRPALRIAYAGTILVKREFAMFVEALEKVRSQMPVELHFWGAHSYQQEGWFRPEWMIEHGNLPERRLIEELRQCDWGFIPMSLQEEDPRYNRFSFPTKFITYLAAGLPVIAIGNPESSVMKMARSYDVGLAIDREPILAESILSALSDESALLRHRDEVRTCAFREFRAEKMRSTLWESWSR